MERKSFKDRLKQLGVGTLNVAHDTVTGEWMSSSFFSRHWKYILLIFSLLMIYIAMRYEVGVNRERVNTLRDELQIAKSEAVREKSLYISNIRESAVRERVDRAGLKLEVRDQPPFTLVLDN